ncbi:MAG: hypothetical protein U0835_05270 [Isosphaeraceae bacterium]
MIGETLCNEELVRRLPLPLAQLYRRAHNTVTGEARLNTAFCLWEATLKLLGSTAVITYADRQEHSPELSERLKNLARPTLGHWWEFVRLLVPALADAGDPGFCEVRDLLLGRSREDMPRAAALDAALREVLGWQTGSRITLRLSELFERLVQFRNREIGHGALGQRPSDSRNGWGPPSLLGVGELLDRLDVLAGRTS